MSILRNAHIKCKLQEAPGIDHSKWGLALDCKLSIYIYRILIPYVHG